ncbi:thiolase C-terminal domain-containing protein [Heyndrickxia vini]|uniref:Thiolase n=1 Tax=Heyndrickxia vini TaxID=1476025 RepID=A0ABX7E3M3_9BACI|nr:thiolase [Heyndrickxia vini]QQZ10161.1 thiolase [Heyndrickxia vini]
MGNIKDRYAIVGVGESERSKNSGTTPLHLALDAARAALNDAGLTAKDIDGVMNYSENDSCTSHQLATYLGVRPKYVKDILGGGSSTEMLIADAIGLIETGQLNTVLIYRSMNGRSGVRMGGGNWDMNMLQNVIEGGSYIIPYGAGAPSQWFGLFASRHMYETGLTKEHLGHVCVSFYEHAQRNPKAFFYGKPLTMEEYLQTPELTSPFNKHDCCLESDEANAIIVTSAERAKDCKSKPVYIMGISARQCISHAHYWSNLSEVASDYVAKDIYQKAGVSPADIQVASIYDCFSWVVLRQLEAYGLAPRGEVGDFVATGNLKMGGRLPTNTAGGMLSEGYTHGMNNVLEIVRQIRHEYGDTDRQVKNCEIGICTGWAGPDIAGAMILRN